MVHDPETEALSKAEFWQRIAAFSFGLWSLMIPVGIWMIGNTFERAMKSSVEQASELIVFNRRFEAYVLQMERRLVIVEERQSRLISSLSSIEEDIHAGLKINGKK